MTTPIYFLDPRPEYGNRVVLSVEGSDSRHPSRRWIIQKWQTANNGTRRRSGVLGWYPERSKAIDVAASCFAIYSNAIEGEE